MNLLNYQSLHCLCKTYSGRISNVNDDDEQAQGLTIDISHVNDDDEQAPQREFYLNDPSVPGFIHTLDRTHDPFVSSLDLRRKIEFTMDQKNELVSFLQRLRGESTPEGLEFKRTQGSSFILPIKNLSRLIPRKFDSESRSRPNKDYWLDDEVISAYMDLLGERPRTKNTHCFFSAFVYSHLVEKKKSNIKRDGDWWYRDANNQGSYVCKGIVDSVPLETLDYLFVPCGTGIHWVLAIIFLKKNEMYLLDSLNPKGKPARPLVEKIGQDYLIPFISFLLLQRTGGSKDSLKNDYNIDLEKEWSFKTMDVPQQENIIDCGVFVCMFADLAADKFDVFRLQDFDFFFADDMLIFWDEKNTSILQANIDYFRLKIAVDILRGDLGY